MKGRQIEHRGVVERIMSHSINVSILQETACSACAAAQLCRSSDKKEKIVEIPCYDAAMYHVGQEVVIVGELGLGLRATLWAYVVPLVWMMAVLIGVSRLMGNEGLGALASLLSLIPYYIGVYLLRDNLQRKFAFNIKS